MVGVTPLKKHGVTPTVLQVSVSVRLGGYRRQKGCVGTERLGGYREFRWIQGVKVDTERLGGYREVRWV